MKMNKEMHSSSSSLISASPSLNSYSSSNRTLAETAARVALELSLDEPLPFDWDDEEPLQQYYVEEQIPHRSTDEEFYGDEDEDGEFEFSFVCGKTESSLVPADEIFQNGQIKPIYPILARDSSTADEGGRIDGEAVQKPTRRPQLGVLMGVDRAEREAESSCSSSEADELDAISPATYSVWKPGAACKKNSSTGSSSASSSRRWKLKQLLLNRSNSDGTKEIVLLAAKKMASGGDDSGKAKAGEEVESCVRNHNNSRRKSFLPSPYRPDLVGFFANVNGLSKNLHPF